MKLAVIQASGKQYLVSEKETIVLDNLKKKKGEKVEFSDVLLFADGKDIFVGKPTVANCKVVGKIVENIKGEKVRIFTYKAKARYRKRKGYRSMLSKVYLEEIKHGKN